VSPVNQRAGTVAFHAPINRRSRDVELSTLLDYCLVEGLAMPLVIFSEVNPEHLGFAFEFHTRVS
jgi:hypothetical protein